MRLTEQEAIKLIQGAKQDYMNNWDYSDFLEEYNGLIKRETK